jgi:DNA-directed RNA polymerase subunit RPC12/RpoP
MHNFASVLKDIGKLDESERLYKSALVTLEKTFGSDHSTTRACKMGLGDVLVAKGEQGEGDSLRGDALFGELVDSLRSRPSTGPVHDLVGFLKQELMAADMNYGPEHDLSVYILRTLVEELSKKGRFDEIEPYLQRAYVLTNASSEAIVCLKTFGHLLRAHNDSERSARFLKRARELFAQVSPSATAEMRTLFKCESCATELNAQAIPIGTQVQCPHCHQEQAVPAHGKSFVVWKCNCGLELQIDAKSSGEKYMCPHCKRQDGLVPFAEDQ